MASKRVLITGADGFIGSHLVETCISAGYNVRAFVFYNSFNSWGWLDRLQKCQLDQIEVFAGDIRDSNAVRLSVENVDIIFHLAALVGIPYSYNSPDSYVDTNIRGTLNVLQAARDHGAEKVIITSTSEVYGTAEYVPIDEKHPLKAQSPYAATKIAAERLAESFYLSFGTPTVIVRPFNTYGPRQSLRAVIPTIVMQCLVGREHLHLGALNPTRDFNYVDDTCRGLVAVARSDRVVGEVINIASEKEISIGDLANRILRKTDSALEVISETSRLRPEKSEVDRLLGCNFKIKLLTGWEPIFDIDEGLARTIDWFQSEQRGFQNKAGKYAV